MQFSSVQMQALNHQLCVQQLVMIADTKRHYMTMSIFDVWLANHTTPNNKGNIHKLQILQNENIHVTD